MESMSISEFARRSRLSPKALRLYDEMGLLPPARVDAVTGYRLYGTDQIEPARLEAVPWAAYCLEDQEKQDKRTHAPQGGSAL